MNKDHIGSRFGDFLDDENIKAETEALALKRVITWQMEQAMTAQSMSKTEAALRMKTSRSAINRLLDPENTGVTLMSIEKMALVLGKKLHLELRDR